MQLLDLGPPQKTRIMGTTPTVKRTFSNAASVPSRPHSFQTKSVKVTEKCHPCGKRIKFGKMFFKCQDCDLVCHKECKLQVRKSLFIQMRISKIICLKTLLKLLIITIKWLGTLAMHCWGKSHSNK